MSTQRGRSPVAKSAQGIFSRIGLFDWSQRPGEHQAQEGNYQTEVEKEVGFSHPSGPDDELQDEVDNDKQQAKQREQALSMRQIVGQPVEQLRNSPQHLGFLPLSLLIHPPSVPGNFPWSILCHDAPRQAALDQDPAAAVLDELHLSCFVE